jgi:hypothetical protein
MQVIVREWTHKNLQCQVTYEDEFLEAWYSGWAAVPRKHPYWGKSRRDLDQHIKVHGGVIVSKQGSENSNQKNKGLWWFGFSYSQQSDDTSRGDLIHANPSLATSGNPEPLRKWTLTDAVVETERLADQLAKAANQ